MVGAPFREFSTCIPIYRGARFRRGEVPSPNGLGDPTPTLRYGSLWIDKSTAPWDHSLLFNTGSKSNFLLTTHSKWGMLEKIVMVEFIFLYVGKQHVAIKYHNRPLSKKVIVIQHI